MKYPQMEPLKRICIQTILAAFIIVSSCKKDDPAPVVKPLVGTWKFTNLKRTICTNSANNGSFDCPGNFPSCTIITFAETTYTKDTDFGINTGTAGTYSINGNNLTITPTGQAPTTYTSFLISGNTLTFSYLGGAPGREGCTFVWTYVKS